MKTTYLFPYRYKWVSGIVFYVSLAALSILYLTDNFAEFEFKGKVFALIGDSGILGKSDWFGWIEDTILDEILFTLMITSGLIYAFSKERTEDEMVTSIRLNSLVKATIGNYLILLFCYIFIYGVSFLNVLNIAMFSQLLIFIALFRISMFRFNKSARYEE